jgi:hypothetical protein
VDTVVTLTGSPIVRPCLETMIRFLVSEDNRASVATSAMGPAQNGTRILTCFWLSALWNVAHALCMAQRDVSGMKIPAEGCSVV